jgi:hypothetical protein
LNSVLMKFILFTEFLYRKFPFVYYLFGVDFIINNDFLDHDVLKIDSIERRRKRAVKFRNVLWTLFPSIVAILYYEETETVQTFFNTVFNQVLFFATYLLFFAIFTILALQVYQIISSRSSPSLIYSLAKKFEVHESDIPYVFHGNDNKDFDSFMKYLLLTHKGGYNSVDNFFIIFENSSLSDRLFQEMKSMVLAGNNLKLFLFNAKTKELRSLDFCFLLTRNSEFYRTADTGIEASESLFLYSLCSTVLNLVLIVIGYRLYVLARNELSQCDKRCGSGCHYTSYCSQYIGRVGIYLLVFLSNTFLLCRNILLLINSGSRVCLRFDSDKIVDQDSQFIFNKLETNKVYKDLKLGSGLNPFEFDSLFFYASNATFLKLPDLVGLDLRTLKLLMASLSIAAERNLRLMKFDRTLSLIESNFNIEMTEKSNFIYNHESGEFYLSNEPDHDLNEVERARTVSNPILK